MMKWINAFDKQQTLINLQYYANINRYEEDDGSCYYIAFNGDGKDSFNSIDVEYGSRQERDKQYYSIMEQLGVQRYK